MKLTTLVFSLALLGCSVIAQEQPHKRTPTMSAEGSSRSLGRPATPRLRDDEVVFAFKPGAEARLASTESSEGVALFNSPETIVTVITKYGPSDWDPEGVEILIRDGKIISVPDHTKVIVLNSKYVGFPISKVRIVNGKHTGKVGWVPDSRLKAD